MLPGVINVYVSQGVPGFGVPTGGTTGQVLEKSSNADYDTEWATPSGGGAVSSVFGRTGAVVSSTDDYAIGQIAGLGTGIATALGINVGSAGSPVLFNGAAGTPSSLALTNATGLPTAGLVDGAVTFAKMQAVTASRLLGNDATGTAVQELSASDGLDFGTASLRIAANTDETLSGDGKAGNPLAFAMTILSGGEL
jgi:hypothetical protein